MTTSTGALAEPADASALIDIGRVLDHGHWTGYQKFVVLLSALTIVFDGVDIQLLGIAIPSIMADWGVARSSFSALLAAGLVGMMIGAVIGGMIGDRLGRRRALIGSVLCFGLFTAASSQSDGLASFGVLRFLAGLGLGGALPNATALTSEYVPLRYRPFAVTLTIVCVPLGGALAGLVAAELLPSLGWRALFTVGGLAPVFVAFLLMLVLPESPRYLVRHPRRWPELMRILRRFGLSLPPHATFVDLAERDSAKTSTRALFSPALRRDTVALWAAFFYCLLAVYTCFNWLPSLLSGAGLSLSIASRGLAAFNLGGVAAAIGGALFIARYGSKRAMLSMATVAVASALVLMVMPITVVSATSTIVMLGITGGAINAVQTTMYALAAHVYPTTVRATGVGSASAIGRFGAISSVFVGSWALGHGGGPSFFLLIGAAMAATAIALALLRGHVPHMNHSSDRKSPSR